MRSAVLPIPPIPPVPDHQRASQAVTPRYEDFSQDGRVMLGGLSAAVGQTIWRTIVDRHPLAALMRTEGVVPILRRLVFHGGPGPHSALAPLQTHGTMALAEQPPDDEGIPRFFVLMWLQATAPQGTVYAPPKRDDPQTPAGLVFAEHVMTRLMAAPQERRPRLLPHWNTPQAPAIPYTMDAAEQLLSLPAGAQALDGELHSDGPAQVFSMMHTDANQHVNSLVYPRLFEEAALRRLRAVGARVGPGHLAREVELRWRKPFFAGEPVELRLRLFSALGDNGAARFGATGGFFAPGEERPHATACVLLDA